MKLTPDSIQFPWTIVEAHPDDCYRWRFSLFGDGRRGPVWRNKQHAIPQAISKGGFFSDGRFVRAVPMPIVGVC